MFDAKFYQIFNRCKNIFYNKNRIAENKAIRPIIFFKSIIGPIQIFGGANPLFL